jgi:1-aminocyclopropane-1-carboxylate deaminase
MIDSFFTSETYAEIQPIDIGLFSLDGFELDILREDLLHPIISGNKFRKLKFNLLEAQQRDLQTILTFGGAYSNHIAATAAAGKMFGIATVGVIRGEELASKITENATLSFAQSCGMKLHFISRSDYKEKDTPLYIDQLHTKFGAFYILPEGGTNALAIKGCAQILSPITQTYDYLCTAVGTGGTMAGIVAGAAKEQKVLGFSALKGTFQEELVRAYNTRNDGVIMDSYCFGGYAKIDEELVRFINEFKQKTQIQLDPIYTGKMMYGIFDQMKSGQIPKNSRILAIHTGGLQAISGMNSVLRKKNLPLLQ